MDLIGKTVRWEDPEFRPGEWFTALVTGLGGMARSYTGTVVDPGTYRDAGGRPLPVGESLPNLADSLVTVVDSEPDTEDPECE